MSIQRLEETFKEHAYPKFPYDGKSERGAIKQFRQIDINIKRLQKYTRPYEFFNQAEKDLVREHMAEFQRKLEESERIISRKNYEGIREYPTEINKLIEIGTSIYNLKEYPPRIRNKLLITTANILQNYLAKGGTLKREDIKSYIAWIVECVEENPRILTRIDLSLILRSFGYTKNEASELRSLIDQYIVQRIKEDTKKEPTEELKEFLRNEFLLISLLERV